MTPVANDRFVRMRYRIPGSSNQSRLAWRKAKSENHTREGAERRERTQPSNQSLYANKRAQTRHYMPQREPTFAIGHWYHQIVT